MHQLRVLLFLSSLAALVLGNDTRGMQFLTSPTNLSRGLAHDSRTQRYASLYKAPAPYRSLGKPLLNSFIVTSRPLELSRNPNRRKSSVEGGTTTTPSPAEEGNFKLIPQFKIECDARRGSCSETITVASSPTTPPTFRQYSSEMIDRFVNTLNEENVGQEIRRNGVSEEEVSGETKEGDSRSQEKDQNSTKLSKANIWYRPPPYRPPDDDDKGWVALEPIPWSMSKISKWTPDQNSPGSRPPETTRPPINKRPSYSSNTQYKRPSTSENLDGPQGSYHWHGTKKPHRPHDSFQSASSSNSPIIITDGKDPEWPTFHDGLARPGHKHPDNNRPQTYTQIRPENNRPQAYLQVRPENNYPNYYPDHRPNGWGFSEQLQSDGGSRRPQFYPTPVVYHDEPSPLQKPHSFSGEDGGQWVALSDTKEYLPKADRRSYRHSKHVNHDEPKNTEQVSPKTRVRTSRRMVRLTVLPSKGNMTTSHGGMLEVDGSFDTVEEDRRKRMLAQSSSEENGGIKDQEVNSYTVHSLVSNNGQVSRVDRAKAVMAAAGAAMIPATVAAILPMVLAQRSRRSVHLWPSSTNEKTKRFKNLRMNVRAF